MNNWKIFDLTVGKDTITFINDLGETMEFKVNCIRKSHSSIFNKVLECDNDEIIMSIYSFLDKDKYYLSTVFFNKLAIYERI